MTQQLATHQKRRDWFKIIRIDLTYAGVCMKKVASICNRDPKTVEHWTLEGEPKDTDARVVLALYRKFCPDKYCAHMKEFDPDFQMPSPVNDGRRELPKVCKARRVKLWRSPAELQSDLFGA